MKMVEGREGKEWKVKVGQRRKENCEGKTRKVGEGRERKRENGTGEEMMGEEEQRRRRGWVNGHTLCDGVSFTYLLHWTV